MRWHPGPIPAAIGEAKQNGAVFVIYVEGEDDMSQSMTATWNDAQVTQVCQEAGFVGMKLAANSEACVQFSQIYPVVCIPSTFFIGDNGVPLEVVGGSLTVEQFLERIHKVRQLHQSKDQTGPPPPAPVPVTSPPPQPQEPTPPAVTTQAEPTPPVIPTPSQAEVTPPGTVANETEEQSMDETVEEKAEDSAPVNEGTVAEDGPAKPSTSEAPSVSTEEEKQQKIEKAKRLIEERREAKRQEEIEEGKLKETERRRQGQEMVKAKQTVQERQARARAEELRKAKEEERLARVRVKEQIARDREERAARYRQEKEEREQAQLVKEQERAAEEASRQAARSEFARLQFRLPDGSSVSNTFSSSDSLDAARRFVAQHLQLQSFAMATMFPRRQFTDADMGSSLLDLGLAPSAALVVLPSKSLKGNVAMSPNGPSEAVAFQARPGASIVSSGGSGGIMDLVWYVLSPLAALWRFLHTFLFGAPQAPGGAGDASQSQPRQQQATFSNSPTGSDVKRRRVQQDPDTPRGTSRREGNVIRFSPNQDPDDDQNTYNGNSTQQM